MAKKETAAQDVNLEEVQALVAKMLAEAKAEAAKIVEEAKAAAGKPKGMTDEEKAAHDAYMNEEVEVKLFKDNDKYKDPVFVAVNGKNVVIERGVKVKIKRMYAEVLENSDKQDYETSKLIEAKSAEFSASGL
jgi:hypothetical protein